jgi:RNA polymerase sigma factor (sigma-70 family)
MTVDVTRTRLDYLVRDNLDMVYAAALRHVKDPHTAADVTQAVFLVLQRKLPEMDPGLTSGTLGAWLMRVTRYACLDAARRTRRRSHHEYKAAAMRSQAAQTGDQEMAGDAVSPMIDEALDRLSRADRELVVLAYYQERSHEEIAARLGIEREAAHKRVQRAVGKLRGILTKRELPAAGIAGGLAALSKPVAAPPAVSQAVLNTLAGQAPALVQMIAKGTMTMLKVMKATTSALMLAAVGLMVAAVALVPSWGQTRAGVQNEITQPGNPPNGDLKLVPGAVQPMPLPGRSGAVARRELPTQNFAIQVTQFMPRSNEALAGRKPFALDLDTQQMLPAPTPEEMQTITLPFTVERWMADHGGDLLFNGAGVARGLVGVDLAILPSEAATIEAAQRAFPEGIVAQLAENGPSSMAVMSIRTQPAIYFVQTREGSIGILEVVSVTAGGESPTEQVMLGYRMLTKEARERAVVGSVGMVLQSLQYYGKEVATLAKQPPERAKALRQLTRVAGVFDRLIVGTQLETKLGRVQKSVRAMETAGGQTTGDLEAAQRAVDAAIGEGLKIVEAAARG